VYSIGVYGVISAVYQSRRGSRGVEKIRPGRHLSTRSRRSASFVVEVEVALADIEGATRLAVQAYS